MQNLDQSWTVSLALREYCEWLHRSADGRAESTGSKDWLPDRERAYHRDDVYFEPCVDDAVHLPSQLLDCDIRGIDGQTRMSCRSDYVPLRRGKELKRLWNDTCDSGCRVFRASWQGSGSRLEAPSVQPAGWHCSFRLQSIATECHAKREEKGISGVGCSQFLSSYLACPSIMWNV